MPVRRKDSSQASTTKRWTRKQQADFFPAMFTMEEMYDLEANLQDIDSHIPRRMALAILAKDSEQLVQRFGESAESAGLLPEQESAIDHYLAGQLKFIAMLQLARDRIAETARRIAAAHPEFKSMQSP